ARALGDTPEIYKLAQEAVLRMAPEDALRFLDRSAEHREAPIRRGAVQALQALGNEEGTKIIWKVYERDIEVDEVRQAARTALRQLRQYLPIERIVQDATSNPEKHSRAKALKLLGVVGGQQAEQVLTAALADEDIYV